jgi:hypothetical protein
MHWVVSDEGAIFSTEGDNLIVTLIPLGRQIDANRGEGNDFVKSLSLSRRKAVVGFLTFLAWHRPSTSGDLGNALATWRRITPEH